MNSKEEPIYAKLVNKKIVPMDDIIKWAQWFGAADRHVGKDKIGDHVVSTVFLGINHWGHWFETIIFRENGESDEDLEMQRYRTYDEAKKGHDDICAALRNPAKQMMDRVDKEGEWT